MLRGVSIEDKEYCLLITGANGCIGNVLLRDLIDYRYKITALALDEYDTDKIKNIGNVKIALGDISDRKKIEEIFSTSIFHVVVHLAGVVHRNNAKYEEYIEVNYKATSELFDLSKKYGVEQFVFVSSVAVYGEDNDYTLNERSPVDPQTPYAVSKWKAEEYIRNNHDNKIKYTIVRPATVYGKYDRGNIDKLYGIAKKGILPILGDGNNIKSFVYVENLVNGIAKIVMNPNAYNETFIVSDKTPYSVNDLIVEIEKVLGKDVFVIRFPDKIVISILKIINLAFKTIAKKELINISSVKKLVTNNVYDISKAENVLNYSPKYSLDEGLKRTYGH